MKYEVYEKVIDKIIEKNIELDKETFEILLKIKNFNNTAQELLEKILLDKNIKDKKKFLNYMIKSNENTSAMNTLLKIINDENIRDNDKYIKLILYKFDDIAREYVLENIKSNKLLDNQEILDFLIMQPELIQKRVLICLKNGMTTEQLNRVINISTYMVDEVLREIESEILNKVTIDLECEINKIGDNPTIDNLKKLQLKQKSYNEIVGIFKTRISGSVETEIEIDKNKKMVLINNIPNNQNK